MVLWQHVVLCKSYASENAPEYGCALCVMLRETGYSQSHIFKTTH